MKARQVFQDCVYARDSLKAALVDGRLDDAKIMWFAALAMLRSIGHVLRKVDAKGRGEAFGCLLGERFQAWKDDPMFYNFIEKERNSILKEYDSSLEEETVREQGSLELSDDSVLELSSGEALTVTTEVATLTKQRGESAGTPPEKVLTLALDWWDRELKVLENSAE